MLGPGKRAVQQSPAPQVHEKMTSRSLDIDPPPIYPGKR